MCGPVKLLCDITVVVRLQPGRTVDRTKAADLLSPDGCYANPSLAVSEEFSKAKQGEEREGEREFRLQTPREGIASAL